MKFRLNTTLVKATAMGLLGAATLGAITLVSRVPGATANMLPQWESISLTDTQRADIAAILGASRTQIEGILTPEQQAAFTDALGDNPRNLGRALQAANLSRDQRTAIHAIMATSRQDISQILTPEQQQQLRQGWRDRRSDQQPGGQRPGGDLLQRFRDLDLTADQRAEVQTILSASWAEMEALLTAEQRATFTDSWQADQNLWAAVQALDLTAEQRVALREIMGNAHRAIAAVLTEEQRQQLRSQSPRRQQGRGRPGPAGR